MLAAMARRRFNVNRMIARDGIERGRAAPARGSVLGVFEPQPTLHPRLERVSPNTVVIRIYKGARNRRAALRAAAYSA